MCLIQPLVGGIVAGFVLLSASSLVLIVCCHFLCFRVFVRFFLLPRCPLCAHRCASVDANVLVMNWCLLRCCFVAAVVAGAVAVVMAVVAAMIASTGEEAALPPPVVHLAQCF